MKNKTSRIISLLVTIIMICVMIPAGIFTVSAKDYTPEEIYKYETMFMPLPGSDHVVITGVTDKFTGGDVVLPTTINGNKVMSINSGVFANQTGITSVTIPGNYAIYGGTFSGCTGIKKVTYGKDMTSFIDANAFLGCTSIESITVEKENPNYQSTNNCVIDKTTKNLVFGCKTSIIPDDGSVTSIGSNAFNGCTGLKSITIPKNITNIYSSAFYGCTGLESVTLLNGEIRIGYNAFTNCTNLESVKLSDKTKSLDPYSFANCTSLTSIDIPSSVTEIVYGVFYGCENLTEIGLPVSVTSIGSDAFDECNKISDVYYAGTKEKKDAIYIGEGSVLFKANWHYNSKLPAKAETSTGTEVANTGSNDPSVKYKTDTGIKISGGNAFAKGTIVTAKRLTKGDIYNNATLAMQGVSTKYQVFEFDANLNGAAVQPNGKVTVTFDLPDDYSPEKLKLFYVKDGKISETIKIKIDGAKKTVTAELDHFSTYVLAEVTSSKTMDNDISELYILFLGLLFAALAIISIDKKQLSK